MKRLLPLIIALWPAGPLAADVVEPDSVVARAARELTGPSAGFEDGPLMQWLQRAMVEATGAEAAISSPLPAGLRIAVGPITVRDVLRLAPEELRLTTTSMTGREIKNLLENGASRFAPYLLEGNRPLLATGATDSLIDSFEGVSYEIDLTRPDGDRVVHLLRRGVPLDPEQRLVVAVDQRRLARGDLPANPDEPEAAWLRVALLAYARRQVEFDDTWEHDWSVLPDYVVTAERGLIDRLVRHAVLPREEIVRLFPEQVARRGDMAYWLARAFGWRERRLSGAFPDVPDSLEPWVDALLRRDVLGEAGREEFFQPFAPVSAALALEWSEGCARKVGLVIEGPEESRSFRRGLLTGVALGRRPTATDTLTRSQILGVIANLRFPEIRVLRVPARAAKSSAGDRDPGAEGDAQTLGARLDRLLAPNPEGTVVFGGLDTVVVRRGVRIDIRGGPSSATGASVTIGSSRVPLPPLEAGSGEIAVTDLLVDPVARRVLDHRAWRAQADGAPAPADPQAASPRE